MQAGTFRTNSWPRFKPSSPDLQRIAQFRGKSRPHWSTDSNLPEQIFARGEATPRPECRRLLVVAAVMCGCAKQYTANAELLRLEIESLLVHSLPIWGYEGRPSEDSPVFLRSPSLLKRKILLPLLLLLLLLVGLCSGFWVTVSFSNDVPTWTT